MWEQLATEAQALVVFVAERDPFVNRRYAHWWDELPGAQVRLLPGSGELAGNVRR